MKRSLKRLALVLSFLLLLSSVVGCGVKDKESAVKDADKDASKVESNNKDEYAPKEDKIYEIKYLVWVTNPSSEDALRVKEINEQFNVKLIPDFVDASKWDEILGVKLASGEMPDILPSKGIDKFALYLDQEILAEVPMEAVKKYAPDYYNMVQKAYPTAWASCGSEGKNYGLPHIVGQYVFSEPIAWRDDWLRNVGINKIPETLDEWEEAFIKFRNDDPNKSGKKDTYAFSTTAISPISGAFGTILGGWGAIPGLGKGEFSGIWFEKDGKVVNTAIEPGARDTLELLSKWYKLELMDPEFVTTENKGGYWAVSTDFVNGRIGVSNHGDATHWDTELSANPKELKEIDPNATFALGLPPIGPDGKTRGTTAFPMNTGASFVFTKNSEPDKIGKILSLYNYHVEDFDQWFYNAYGVVGKHVTENIDNNGNLTGYKFIEEDPAKRVLELGFGVFFHTQPPEYVRKVTPAYFEKFEKLGFSEHGVSDLAYQLYMPSIGKYITDLRKMTTEAYVNIITGEKPIEYFDEFVEKWKKNGGQILLDEANEYYKKSKAK